MDDQAAVDQPIRFEILGPLRAWQGTEELELGPTKQRAVLAFLLLNANTSASIAHIIDAVWGDEPPENGPNVVQKYVGGLRRILEPNRSPRAPGQLISRTDVGYRLSVDPDHLDIETFRDLVREAHAARAGGDPATAAELLVRANGLWRGEPLAGLAGPAFDAARTRLEEDRASALETWADLEVTFGEPSQVVPALLRLVAEYPLREQLRYLLILALYRAGRQAEALAAYREARQFLADEFGVDPGERLQDLHRRMLRADPALAPSPATVSAVPVSPPVTLVPLPPPVAAMAFPPPAHPFGRDSPPWWQVLARVLGALVPLLSCGFGSWAVIGVYAALRRSILQGVAAAGYLVLVFLALEYTGHDGDTLETIGVLSMLVAFFGGAVHAGVLGWLGPRRRAPERLARQETAHAIFQYSPSIARQLHIGRPDLPMVLDDGGVLDVNTAPDWLIAALPGIGPADAAAVIRARNAYGALPSLDHLLTTARFSRRKVRILRELLIFAPPPAAGDPGPGPFTTGAAPVPHAAGR
ncbi:BTAD domain-containing putative transcriptional regulator [Dactylosporangium sp. NPDC048998]|uniref:BTAD domain-containing putative transcriptional regulator n=1 Tax=Dactylosporangium sp. NPDC048998 TaxID=3363976 RepID=UPI003715E67D